MTVLGALPEEIACVAGRARVDHLVHRNHAGCGGAFDLDEVLEVRTLVPDLEELRHLIGVLDHRRPGPRVLRLIRDLRRIEGAVDRGVHRAEIDDGEIADDATRAGCPTAA